MHLTSRIVSGCLLLTTLMVGNIPQGSAEVGRNWSNKEKKAVESKMKYHGVNSAWSETKNGMRVYYFERDGKITKMLEWKGGKK